jgi:hypothetical protein
MALPLLAKAKTVAHADAASCPASRTVMASVGTGVRSVPGRGLVGEELPVLVVADPYRQ